MLQPSEVPPSIVHVNAVPRPGGGLFQMMSLCRQKGLGAFRRWSLLLLVFVGLALPSLIVVVMEMTLGGTPLISAIGKVVRRQFASGENLFLIAILGLIPFVLLAGVLRYLSPRLTTYRFTILLVFGMLGIFALMIPAHMSVWRPLYTADSMSSTAAIAFVFIPVYCVATMLVGLGVGWGISLLRFRQSSS